LTSFRRFALLAGSVRRPPRGVPKAEFARQDWYDVWFPNLAQWAAASAGAKLEP